MEQGQITKTRITLDFGPEQMEKLRSLQARCGLKSPEDFIIESIKLFDWAMRESEEGKTVCAFYDKNEVWVPETSALEFARNNRAKE